MTDLSDLPEDVLELQRRIADDADDFEAREALAEALIDLGQTEAGLQQLYTAAERRGDRGAFQEAIELLTRLLEIDPEHDRAGRLQARFFRQIPRQPAVSAPVGEGTEEEYGNRLFTLPQASAAVLSQLLPFHQEDPPPIPGDIVVPLPPAAAEPPKPLLATLDRELRRTVDPSTRGLLDAGEPTGVGRLVEPLEYDEAARTAVSEYASRVSPASRMLGVTALPPNPIIDVLETSNLEKLLTLVDLLRYETEEIVFDGWSPTRALYVVVQGRLHVQREVEDQGWQTIDVLEAGDFFGEFELLTVTATYARILAAEPAQILEIPERIVDEIAERNPEIRDLLWDAFFQRSFHSMMATSPIFSGLPVAVINRIASELEPLQFEVGDIVLRQGEMPQGLHGVVGGSLAVVRPSEGLTEIVTRLGPGDFFGLLSSTSGAPSRASVVATENATLLWLPIESLESLRQTLPAFESALAAASQNRLWRYKLDKSG